jgi:hypothetical protein
LTVGWPGKEQDEKERNVPFVSLAALFSCLGSGVGDFPYAKILFGPDRQFFGPCLAYRSLSGHEI